MDLWRETLGKHLALYGEGNITILIHFPPPPKGLHIVRVCVSVRW